MTDSPNGSAKLIRCSSAFAPPSSLSRSADPTGPTYETSRPSTCGWTASRKYVLSWMMPAMIHGSRACRERPVLGPASVLGSSRRFFAIKSLSRAVVSCVRSARVVPGAVPPGAEGVKGTTASRLSSATARRAAPSKARSDIEQEGSQCLCPTEF